MFSKFSSKKLIAVQFMAAALLFSSCDKLPLNESPPPQVVNDQKVGGEAKCLKDQFPVFESYFKGEASQEQIDSLFTCLNSAISAFEKDTRGETAELYTPRAIADFVEEYFMSKGDLSNEVVLELARVKVLLLGGTETHVSKTELRKLRSFLTVFKNDIKTLSPHVLVLIQNWSHPSVKPGLEASSASLEAASEALKMASQNLIQQIKDNGGSYNLADLKGLIQGIYGIGKKAPPAWVANLDNTIPLFIKLKQTLMGGGSDTITKPEWVSFGDFLSVGYLQLLKFRYYRDFSKGKTDEVRTLMLADLSKSVLRFVAATISAKPLALISNRELIEVLAAAEKVIPDLNSEAKDEEAKGAARQNMVSAFFYFKQIFLGGASSSLSAAEVSAAVVKIDPAFSFFNYVQSEKEFLSGKLVLTGDAAAQRAEFARRNLIFRTRVNSALGLLSGPVRVETLKISLSSFSNYLGIKGNLVDAIKAIDNYAGLAQQLKTIAYNNPSDVLGDALSPWNQLGDIYAGAFSLFLQFKYFVSGTPFNEAGSKNWSDFSKVAIDWLVNLSAPRKGEPLASTELIDFLKAIEKFVPSLNSEAQTEAAKALARQNMAMSFFYFKQILVGGAATSLSIEDLKATSLKVEPAFDFFVYLQNEKDFLTGKLSLGGDLATQKAEFARRTIAFRTRVKSALGLLVGSLKLESVKTSVRSLSSYLGPQAGLGNVIKALDDYSSVAQQLKTVAFNNPSEVLGDAQAPWSQLSDIFTGAYSLYLQFSYFVKGTPLTDLESQKWNDFASGALDWLVNLSAPRKGAPLSQAELENLIMSLAPFLKLGNKPLSRDLVAQILALKSTLVAGSPTSWTNAEINQLKSIFEKGLSAYFKLKSVSSFLSFKWAANFQDIAGSTKYFNESLATTKTAADEFLSSLSGNYDLEKLPRFLKLLESQGVIDGTNLSELIEKNLYLVLNVRSTLQNDFTVVNNKGLPRSVLGGNSAAWKKEVTEVMPMLRLFYFGKYFLTKQDLLQSPVLPLFKQFVFELYESLHLAQQRRANLSGIQLWQIHQVITLARNQGLFVDSRIKDRSLITLYEAVLGRLLKEPATRLTVPNPNGREIAFTPAHQKFLFIEFNIWYQAQVALDQWFRAEPKMSAARFTGLVKNETQVVGLKELDAFITTPLHLAEAADARLDFSTRAATYNRSTANKLNLVRAAIRAIFRGYAGEISRTQGSSKLTLAEFEQGYKELKDIFVDLEFLDPDDLTFASSRFREANWFTPRGDGDEFLSAFEGFDIARFVLSGVVIGGQVEKTILNECQLFAAPLKMNRRVPLSCLLGIYQRDINKTFYSMPMFVQQFRALNAQWGNQFLSDLVEAAGYIPTAEQRVKLADAGRLPHISQYIESIMLIYDLDLNGVLDTSEAMAAYPRFARILRQLAEPKGIKDEREIRALYAWLLKKEKLPTGTLEQLDFKFSWSRKQEQEWRLAATRVTLSKILEMIAEALRTPPAPPRR